MEVRLIPRPRSLFCQVDRLAARGKTVAPASRRWFSRSRTTFPNRCFPFHHRLLAELDNELQDANAAGQHIYIGANPRKRQGGKAKDVAVARCVFVDLDKMTVDEGLRRIAEAGLPVAGTTRTTFPMSCSRRPRRPAQRKAQQKAHETGRNDSKEKATTGATDDRNSLDCENARESSASLTTTKTWRRRESNPRPEAKNPNKTRVFRKSAAQNPAHLRRCVRKRRRRKSWRHGSRPARWSCRTGNGRRCSASSRGTVDDRVDRPRTRHVAQQGTQCGRTA